MKNTDTPITAYKGFDKDLKCRDFQYEVGKTYSMDGDINCCSRGFHACIFPLDVFDYYNPANSRYCQVEQSGQISEDDEDSKQASSKIHIQAEIGLKGIINAGVKFILDKVNWKDNKQSNTGNYSAATNTGYKSAATNTGDKSAATNTGDQSAAIVEGKESIAFVSGYKSKANGALGCWLVLTERDYDGHILGVQAVKVDDNTIKPNTFYQLINGEVTEVTEVE